MAGSRRHYFVSSSVQGWRGRSGELTGSRRNRPPQLSGLTSEHSTSRPASRHPWRSYPDRPTCRHVLDRADRAGCAGRFRLWKQTACSTRSPAGVVRLSETGLIAAHDGRRSDLPRGAIPMGTKIQISVLPRPKRALHQQYLPAAPTRRRAIARARERASIPASPKPAAAACGRSCAISHSWACFWSSSRSTGSRNAPSRAARSRCS